MSQRCWEQKFQVTFSKAKQTLFDDVQQEKHFWKITQHRQLTTHELHLFSIFGASNETHAVERKTVLPEMPTSKTSQA